MRRSESLSRRLWWTLLIISLSLSVPLVWSFLYLDTNTGAYTIAQVNLLLLGFLIVGTAVFLYVGWEPF